MLRPVILAITGCVLLHPGTGHAIDWTKQMLFPPQAGAVEYPSIAFAQEFNPGFPLIITHAADLGVLYDVKNGVYVDSNGGDGDTGAYSSMVVDATGVVHVAYNAQFRRRYAKRVANVWTVTNIGDRNTGCSPYFESLALDANNRPTIAAYDPCFGQVSVRSFNGTTWDPSDDYIPEAGGFPSLQIAADGTLCVAFINSSGLRYARRVSGVWSIEPVAAGEGHPSLRLRSDGSPVIAFTATANGGPGTFLRIATKVGGSWQFENLGVSGSHLGESPDLRLGPQDLPRVTYTDFLQTLQDGSSQFVVRYAMKTSTGWTFSDATTIVALYPDMSYYFMPRLVLDAASDEPHIAYINYATGTGATDYVGYLHGTFPPPPPPDDGGGCPRCIDPSRLRVVTVRSSLDAGEVVVQLSVPYAQVVRSGLFDLAGRQVATASVVADNGVHEVHLRVEGLERGVYFVRIQGGSGEAVTRKVVAGAR